MMTVVSSYVPKALFLAQMGHGCILTWFLKNMNFVTEKLTIQAESVSLVLC